MVNDVKSAYLERFELKSLFVIKSEGAPVQKKVQEQLENEWKMSDTDVFLEKIECQKSCYKV